MKAVPKTDKGINIRYSLMKCSRKSTSSRRIPYNDHDVYSKKETWALKYNTDLPFSSNTIHNSTIEASIYHNYMHTSK